MTYNKGEQIPLYVEFKQDGNIINVDQPRVKVLHEKEDKIYEDMSWKNMTQFENGYIYNFDSNICDTLGEYVIIYEGFINGEKLNSMEVFNLTSPNEADKNSINNIKIYGFVDDLNKHELLENVCVKIKNLIDSSIVYQTNSDYSGRWEAYAFPGEFEFEFSLNGYETKTLQVQIGDENEEVQFNNISLENTKDVILGSGMFKISDEFTDKTGMGINGITINIFSLNNPDSILLTTKTDFHGKWSAFLDPGGYLLKIQLPSGIEKLLRMNIDSKGIKTITEIKKSNSVNIDNVNTTIGSKSITDYVKDAHGNGLSNVHVKVFQNDELIGETYTGIDGSFTLNLDNGIYKITCEKDKFKSYSFELKI